MRELVHGTYGAYQRHKRHGPWPADVFCRNANADHMARNRARGKCVKGLGWPAEIPRFGFGLNKGEDHAGAGDKAA